MLCYMPPTPSVVYHSQVCSTPILEILSQNNCRNLTFLGAMIPKMGWLRRGFKNQLMHEMKCCFILMVDCHLMHSFKPHVDGKLEYYYHLVEGGRKPVAVCQCKSTYGSEK